MIASLKTLSVSGIQDSEDWHGKALGDKASTVLETIKENIVNQGPHGLVPKSPEKKVPEADTSAIRLSEPPNYQLNQSVRALPILPPLHTCASRLFLSHLDL